MTKKILVSDSQLVDALRDWLEECDADDLARIAGDAFGGTCYYVDDERGYEFETDENYFGALDEKPKMANGIPGGCYDE